MQIQGRGMRGRGGKTEDMKCETFYAQLLETACGAAIINTSFESHKDIAYYINVAGIFLIGRFLQIPYVMSR